VSEITREQSELAGQWIVKQTVVQVNSPTVGVQLCEHNPLRWELLIGTGLSGLVSAYGIGLSADGANQGVLAIGSNSPTFRLNFRQSGGLVSQAWYGFVESSTLDLTVIELVMQQ
jgi:hypothetical protein